MKNDILFRRTQNADSMELVAINEDSRAVVLESIGEIAGLLPTLRKTVEEGSLTVSGRSTLVGLLLAEAQLVSKTLGHDEDQAQDRELVVTQLREANEEIRTLQKELGKKASLQGLGGKLAAGKDGIYKWWSDLGFGHSEQILHPSLNGAFFVSKFSVMIWRRRCTFSTTPVSDQKNLDTKNAELTEELEIVADAGGDFQVVDTPANRQWFFTKLLERFPNCMITGLESHSIIGEPFRMSIRTIEARIELTDVLREENA